MNFDLNKMRESKNTLRRKLAILPVAEKLAMLDVLRERELDIRKAAGALHRSIVSETPATYEAKPDGKMGNP